VEMLRGANRPMTRYCRGPAGAGYLRGPAGRDHGGSSAVWVRLS